MQEQAQRLPPPETTEEGGLALLIPQVIGQGKQIRPRQSTERNPEQPCQHKAVAFLSLQHYPILSAAQ